MTIATMTRDDPIFRCTHYALESAYQYDKDRLPGSPVFMMRGESRTKDFDCRDPKTEAFNAGVVKRAIGGLPSEYKHMIVCKYTLSMDEFRMAFNGLVRQATDAIGAGVTPTRLIIELVEKSLGRPVKLAALCDTYSMDAATMTRRWQRVRERMRALESQAMQAADDALVMAGLVE